MAGLRRRYNKWEAKVRIPKELQSEFGGKDHLYRTLEATDRRTAKVEAEAWESALRLEWAERRGAGVSRDNLRNLYQRVLSEATEGRFQVHIADNDTDPVDEATRRRASGRPSTPRDRARSREPTLAGSSPASRLPEGSPTGGRPFTASERTSPDRWSGLKCLRTSGLRYSGTRRDSPTAATIRTGSSFNVRPRSLS